MDPEARQTPPEFRPLNLSGRHVSLVPLAMQHCDALVDAVQDGDVWRVWYTSAPEPGKVKQEIDRRLGLQAEGSMIPFTVLDEAGRVVGMTTYMNIQKPQQRVEIGSTWYARSVQRTPLNTEAKLLLMAHAFDQLRTIAVEFRVHSLNHVSRRAVERLGARFDGVIRNEGYTRNGLLRDMCIYSVLPMEWPAVKTHLQWQLDRPRS
jgi:RimJ/RimL family protein N-acetyltransferase